MPLNESRRLDLRNTVLWIAVGVGVTLRLLYAFLAQVEPWSDFESYVSMAHNIVRGVPIHTRLAPGYPVFLSGVYLLQGSIEAVWVANALLGGLGIVLVYGLTEKFWDDRKVAETAAWIAAVFPDFSVYAGVPASENLVIPLVLLVVLCLVAGQERGRLVWWVLAGLALGGAFLVRGMLLGILPLFVGWIWLDAYKGDLRRSVLPCLLLISSSVVVVAPWTVRNWGVHGAFVPVTTQMGLGLWGGNNPEADGEWMDDFLDRQPIPTELSEVERSRYQTRQALSFMVKNPLDIAVLAIKKFGLFWGIKMDGVYRWPGGLPPGASLVVSTIGQISMVALFMLGMLLTYPWTVRTRAALVVTLYLLLVTMAFYYNTRYRLLLYPLWAPFVAYAINRILSRRLRWETFPISPRWVIGLSALLLGNWLWMVWRNTEKIGTYVG